MEKNNSAFILRDLRKDAAQKQKRGLHFIIASVFIWAAILAINISAMPIETRNLFTFFCSAPLIPIAYLISKLIKADFKGGGNPLNNLGLLFTLNQILYILIAMWLFNAMPEKMLMVYAMIFGAHLLPFGWLYCSKAYYAFSVIIPVCVLILGIIFSSAVIALFMLITEIVFCTFLFIENKMAERR